MVNCQCRDTLGAERDGDMFLLEYVRDQSGALANGDLIPLNLKCTKGCSIKHGIIRNIQYFLLDDSGALPTYSVNLLSDQTLFSPAESQANTIYQWDAVNGTWENMSVFIPFCLKQCDLMYLTVNPSILTGKTVSGFVRVGGVTIP